jgi:hypothetical protein
MALNLQHQTAAEFAARFWRKGQEAYQAGDKLTYHRLIWWVWTKIQAGDLTSDQVRLSYNAAFGKSLNTPQWNNLVTTRFVPMKDRYLAFLAEGEL